jgi:uncharacterized membrane protein YfcA
LLTVVIARECGRSSNHRTPFDAPRFINLECLWLLDAPHSRGMTTCTMDLLHILLLLVSGVIGGAISALVGGAAIITFPTLLAAGLAPMHAIASNMVALIPGNFLAALYDRGQLPPLGWSFVALCICSLAAAGLGAVLLLLTPARVFAVLVPILLGFATVLFAYAGPISEWLKARATARGRAQHWGSSIAATLPVSVYSGYFGAGVGVMLLGVLSVNTGGDYRSANVTKNLLTSLNSVVAASVFIWQGAVVWLPTLVMMAGALVGALIGARLAQVVPREVMRVIVVIVGAILTAAFAWRYWF